MTDARGTLDTVANPDTSETPEVAGVVDVPLAALKPHPRNPRKIRPERLEQLKRNLLADAAMLRARPLIALPDGTVIAGNQRLRAATELGWETIPVAYADLDEERATIWAIRDNRGFGEDDVEITGALLSELASAGADLDLTGYSSSDIDALLAATRPDPPVDPDDAPPLPDGEPSSQMGEVYELGAHRLMCGDATDAAQVRRLFDGAHPFNLVECVWTDPPYGVGIRRQDERRADNPGRQCGRNTRTRRRRATGDRGGADAELREVLCRGPAGAATDGVLPGARRHRLADPRNARLGEGRVRARLQRLPLPPRGDPVRAGRPGRGAHAGTRWAGDNAQDTVFEIPRPTRSEEHPTMKPVALIERCLRNSTRRRDVVYDPFAGSGSTIIACEALGRQAFAMEIDPAYCDVIRRRFATFTDQPHLAP